MTPPTLNCFFFFRFNGDSDAGVKCREESLEVIRVLMEFILLG